MEKLYYQDSALRQFSATVTDCVAAEEGFWVCLDATAFYPEGGGQACDLGYIGDARVLDVQEKGDRVTHLCDKMLAVGQKVACCIDWERRFDLMQQHTGEHIVSGVIFQMLGYANVGFHVGADVMTVDFDGEITPEQLKEIEFRANRAVWENITLRCWIPGPEELPNVPYRTKRQLPWPVRIVEIPGVDSCACCGVHTKTTGQVGLIKLFSCVKFHGGARIEMACGKRALEMMNGFYEQNRQVSQAFSAKATETGAAARYMNEQLSLEKFRANGLQRELFALKAKSFAGESVAVCFETGLEGGQLRAFAEELARVCPVGAVFSENRENNFSVCLAGKVELVKILGAALAKNLSARGGGKPGYYQGSVAGTKEQIETVLGEFYQVFG